MLPVDWGIKELLDESERQIELRRYARNFIIGSPFAKRP